MGYVKEDESEEKVYQEYGVANLNDTIKNQYSEDVHHVRLGINKRVDSYTRSGESEMEYTSIDYMLQIKLYYGEDYGYEDDYDTPGLGLVNIIINNSTGAILSESESGSIVFSDPISEESYFFDEFEELFDSDIEDFGDQLKTEFNNAINSFEKDWVNNIKSDKDFKIELEKLFDFNKILTRLKEYQFKIIEENIVVDNEQNELADQLEIVKTFYDDGTLQQEYQINTKQEKDGYHRIYYPNGQLKVESIWTNGLQDDGDVISYHDDGSKARQVTLVNHLMNGNYFEWYKNGQLKTQGIYNDKIPTILKQWDENGTLIKQMKFNNETLRTAVKEWLEDNKKAEASYGHISDWDNTEVTNMQEMFWGDTKFNQPLGNWDVSNVTNMESMFRDALSFNQDLSNWDVSSVTDMSYMFKEAVSFNQPIGNWDVSKVTDMSYMFRKATSFNQPLNNWDVSSVTDMSYMFEYTPFNQPIGDWDVSNVTDVSEMFEIAAAFNQDIGSWKLKGRIDHDIECKGTLFFTLKDGSEISISVEYHALIEYVALHEDGVWYMADEPNFLDSMFLTTSVTPQSIIEIADIKKLFDCDTYDEYDWNGSGGGDCKTLKEWNDFKSKLSRVTSKDQLYFKKHNDK